MTGIAVKDIELSGMVDAQLASLVGQGHTVDEAAQMMDMTTPAATGRLRALDPALVDVDVTPEEVREMFGILKGITRDRDENSGLRSKNARWLIDEAKGRNQIKVGITGGSVNVLVINERLESARTRKLASLAE